MQRKDEEKKPAKKILFTTDGTKVALNGYCMYFLRTSTKRNLGEETFQVSTLHKHQISVSRLYKTIKEVYLVDEVSVSFNANKILSNDHCLRSSLHIVYCCSVRSWLAS